jgi:hypothetical protein
MLFGPEGAKQCQPRATPWGIVPTTPVFALKGHNIPLRRASLCAALSGLSGIS